MYILGSEKRFQFNRAGIYVVIAKSLTLESTHKSIYEQQKNKKKNEINRELQLFVVVKVDFYSHARIIPMYFHTKPYSKLTPSESYFYFIPRNYIALLPTL